MSRGDEKQVTPYPQIENNLFNHQFTSVEFSLSFLADVG